MIARYPTGTVSWELPAGGIQEGESILEAAEREVREETGYETSSHRKVYTYYPLNGISNMAVQLVHCLAGQRSGECDPDEVLEIRWFYQEEIREMIERCEIIDGFSLAGLLLYLSQW